MMVEISQERHAELLKIEKQWTELENEMAKCYEEDSEASLIDIGEMAAIHFGFLE